MQAMEINRRTLMASAADYAYGLRRASAASPSITANVEMAASEARAGGRWELLYLDGIGKMTGHRYDEALRCVRRSSSHFRLPCSNGATKVF